MKRNIAALAFILLSLSVPLAVFSEPLTITLHPIPLLVDQTDENKIDGILVRRIQKAFSRMHKEIDIQILPWGRAYHNLQQARIKVLGPMLKNADRETFADFSKYPVHFARYVLAVRQNFQKLNAVPEDLSELSFYRVGYVKGFSLMERLDAVKGKFIPSDGTSYNNTQAVKTLINKRIDILIADEDSLNGALYELDEQDNVMILKPPVQEKKSYLAFSKKHQLGHIISQFDQAVLSMIQDGTYDKILADYLAEKDVSLHP